MGLVVTIQPGVTVYIGQEKNIKISFKKREGRPGYQADFEAPKAIPISIVKPKGEDPPELKYESLEV